MSALISEEYRKMQEELHNDPKYGEASMQHASTVAKLLKQINPSELLDYGAGKGRLGEALKELVTSPLHIRHYDPARPEWSAMPQPAAFVTCIDVLEHIEPELLDNVLDDLQRVTVGHGFFTVHTGPAIKILVDGRNAHLIQRPSEWWLPKLRDRFDLMAFEPVSNGFCVVVTPKTGEQPDNFSETPSKSPPGILRKVLKSLFR